MHFIIGRKADRSMKIQNLKHNKKTLNHAPKIQKCFYSDY